MSNTKAASTNRRWWLVLITIVFTWVVFGSRYLCFPLHLVHQIAPGLDSLQMGIYVLLYPFDLLFTYLGLYTALSALGLLLTATALIWSRPSWFWRIALLVGLLAIVALPTVYRYQPAVRVESEYTVRVPTQPGLLGGVVKAAQAGAEVRRCEYELLGWSKSEGALYGEEICGQRKRTWVYWPLSDNSLETVSSAPDDLLRERAMSVEGVHSQIPLDDSLSIAVREPILRSPEGWWCAFVARHVYGPEDVVVVSTSPRNP